MKVHCCAVRTTPEGALFFGTLPGLANLSFWQEQMQLVAAGDKVERWEVKTTK